MEVIYIQWTSVSKFISISFCLFQWKLKFLSSKWLIHVVSERCDISRFSWLGTLLHLELWNRVRVLFFSLAFYGIFWDAISGYKVINSALAELLFFWRSFQNIARFLFCDWFWAFHSFWTRVVRVWIQINWITFSLTRTFKERKKSAHLRNTQVFWKTVIYCFWILWRLKNAQNSD